jgi:hypothetical protein
MSEKSQGIFCQFFFWARLGAVEKPLNVILNPSTSLRINSAQRSEESASYGGTGFQPVKATTAKMAVPLPDASLSMTRTTS